MGIRGDDQSEREPKSPNFVPFSQHLPKNGCADRQLFSPFIAAMANVGLFLSTLGKFQSRFLRGTISMLKFVILSVASLAFVGTAAAADLPRPQPVAPPAPVGKAPVGKYPVGKSPVGKYPVAAPGPLVTKG